VNALRILVAALALASASRAVAAKKPLGSGDRIDLARATVAELMRLPNIGRRKAEAIVAQRSRAPFHRVEDLLTVKGISQKWLDRQRPHLAVGPAAAPRASVPAKGGPGPKGK
jgi:competence protein ComEA